MKKLLIVILALGSISTFASTYICEISVLKNGEKVGQVSSLLNSTSSQVGRIAEAQLFEKKNVFGKKVREVKVVLHGLMTSKYSRDESFFKGGVTLVETIKGKEKETLISNIEGNGSFSINGGEGEYEVEGSCFHLSLTTITFDEDCED